MKANMYLDNQLCQSIEGDDIEDLIESNFRIFKKIIQNKAGNAAGYELENVWITRVSDAVCELHVIAHGDDSMLNYNAIEEESKEVVFKLEDIPVEEFDGTFEFELTEKKEFNPFDEQWYSDKSSVLGILEACVDYLCESVLSPKDYLPKEKVEMMYPTLKNNSFPRYVNQLMLQFGYCNVKQTNKNKDVFDLIDKVSGLLADLTMSDRSKINGSESLFYYKTRNYLRKRDKITALKFYREKSGKTQTEMANAIGISLRQYQRYESTGSALGNANRIVVEKIAKILSIATEDIVDQGLIKMVKI